MSITLNASLCQTSWHKEVLLGCVRLQMLIINQALYVYIALVAMVRCCFCQKVSGQFHTSFFFFVSLRDIKREVGLYILRFHQRYLRLALMMRCKIQTSFEMGAFELQVWMLQTRLSDFQMALHDALSFLAVKHMLVFLFLFHTNTCRVSLFDCHTSRQTHTRASPVIQLIGVCPS